MAARKAAVPLPADERSPRNGLTADEEKALRRRASQCEAVLTRRGNLGGSEVRLVERLRGELLLRIDPTSVETLERRAAEILDPMLNQPAVYYWLHAAAEIEAAYEERR
jgi:hypothetical protein